MDYGAKPIMHEVVVSAGGGEDGRGVEKGGSSWLEGYQVRHRLIIPARDPFNR